ncbi:hypothetical protein ILYODFUR_003086 [Ilyodon furcidens]|uniref:Uncharacterized protein n=1 Tax=Ilyodon furcidens TaxID=33524 RepID=A0ABV0VAL2_9TELE
MAFDTSVAVQKQKMDVCHAVQQSTFEALILAACLGCVLNNHQQLEVLCGINKSHLGSDRDRNKLHKVSELSFRTSFCFLTRQAASSCKERCGLIQFLSTYFPCTFWAI